MRAYEPTFLKLISIALAIIFWWAVSLFFPPSIIPGPVITFSALWHDALTGALWVNTAATLERVFIGFILALVTGIGIGIAIGLSRRVENLLNFIILIILSIPGPALAIIALMWFGLNQWATIAVSYAIVLPLVSINVQEGMKNVSIDLMQLAKSYNASRYLTLRSIVIPSLTPYIYSASRYSLGIALKVAVIAELFGVTSGIGYELEYYYSLFRMDQVFAWTVMFTIIILLFDVVIFKGLESSLFKWRKTIAEV